MKRKKGFLVMLALFAFVLTTTACGSNDGAGGQDTIYAGEEGTQLGGEEEKEGHQGQKEERESLTEDEERNSEEGLEDGTSEEHEGITGRETQEAQEAGEMQEAAGSQRPSVDLSVWDAYAVILNGCSRELICDYMIDEAFLAWVTNNYGADVIFALADAVETQATDPATVQEQPETQQPDSATAQEQPETQQPDSAGGQEQPETQQPDSTDEQNPSEGQGIQETESTDSDLWYHLTGNSIHVLWSQYCRDSGYQNRYLERVYWKECASPEQTVLDFIGDINFAEDWSSTRFLDQQVDGLYDCFSADLLAELNQADIMMVNNEFTYSTRGEPVAGKDYVFRADPDRVYLLEIMGTDIVSLANNHAYDYGPEALLDTMATLNEAQIPYVGAGANLEEAEKPSYFIANGKKIAIVSATQVERTLNYTKEATETEEREI